MAQPGELIPLERSGVEPTFLHLRPSIGTKLYVFEDQATVQASYWDVLAMTNRSTKEDRLQLRLMHIEEEALGVPDFIAERDSEGYMALTPAKAAKLVSFLRSSVPDNTALHLSRQEHFSAMTDDLWQELRLPAFWPPAERKRFYWYEDETTIQAKEVCFLSLPTWESGQATTRLSALAFYSFPESRLSKPDFKPFDTPGLGYMSFTAQSLREMLAMISERLQP